MLLNTSVPMRVPLTLACGDYDRTATLARGEVRPEGVDLTFLALPVEETFFRMARHREFDAAEMSLSSYLISREREPAPFVAIPAFVSRSFRHNGIYVSPASGISAPADLAGRVVGVAEYQLTANVWIRGILAERYGVPVSSVRYRTGGRFPAAWAYADAERTRCVMGGEFWTYGLAGNEETLGTFVRYAWEQGLVSQQTWPAALFAAETREAYVI
jgi:hypothetical protein